MGLDLKPNKPYKNHFLIILCLMSANVEVINIGFINNIYRGGLQLKKN